MSPGFALLQRFLRETSGFAVEADKAYLIEDRLKPILHAADLSGLEALAQCLHCNPRSALARSVVEALTINETSFFRDRSLFNVLSERLLPTLVEARKERRRLRIWCAGCSTGQEPYSLAMIVDEHARRLSGWQVEIVATDLSKAVVERAKRATYSQFEVQRGLPVSMLLRYFRQHGDHWQLNDYLRSKVCFRTHNLMADPRGLGRFDVIFCRNVLIYFGVAEKRRVLAALSGVLADDGILALGAAETVAGLSPTLVPRETHFVFQKEAEAASRRALSA